MQGRIALVTGATGGIGTEIARGLVARGALSSGGDRGTLTGVFRGA